MILRKIWFIIVPLVLFALLALCIEAGITTNFEGWAYSEAVEHMSPAITTIVKGITHMGDLTVVIVFCLFLIAIPMFRRTIALPVSIAVILSALLNLLLKNIFVRERPDILRLLNETSYSFPSGHAMINGTLYLMFILLIYRFIKSTPKKILLISLCVIITIAIGFSRLYLGVHYAGDIIGGWLIGFAVSIAVYTVWSKTLLKNINLN